MSTKPRNRRAAHGGQRPAILATSIAALFAFISSPGKRRARNPAVIADAGNGSTTGHVSVYDAQTGALLQPGLFSGLDGAYNLAMNGQYLYISTASGVYYDNPTSPALPAKLISKSGIFGMAVSADGKYALCRRRLEHYQLQCEERCSRECQLHYGIVLPAIGDAFAGWEDALRRKRWQ